jgi:hypothetical protein
MVQSTWGWLGMAAWLQPFQQVQLSNRSRSFEVPPKDYGVLRNEVDFFIYKVRNISASQSFCGLAELRLS